MSGRDHKATLDTITRCARTFVALAATVSPDEIKTAQHAVSMADSVGPLLDPTQWMRANETNSLERQQKLLQWFKQSRDQLSEIFPDAAAMLNPSEVIE